MNIASPPHTYRCFAVIVHALIFPLSFKIDATMLQEPFQRCIIAACTAKSLPQKLACC